MQVISNNKFWQQEISENMKRRTNHFTKKLSALVILNNDKSIFRNLN